MRPGSSDRRRARRPAAAPWRWALGHALLLGARALGEAVPLPRCRPPHDDFSRAPPLPFGVEMEFNGVDEATLAAAVSGALEAPVATAPAPGGGWRRGPVDAPDKGARRGWRVVPDSSLSGRRSAELVTDVLGEGDLWQLDAAVAAAAAAGATVDAMATVHVHLAHAALDAPRLAALALALDRHEALVMRLVGTSPRQRSLFCRPLSRRFVAALRAAPPPDKQALWALHEATFARLPGLTHVADARRYHGLNLAYLGGGETIELRYFAGTVSPAALRAFVDLARALGVAARDGELACLEALPLRPELAADRAAFLDAIGLTGPRFAASRALLLERGRTPRPFELFDHELAAVAARLAAAAAAGVVAGRAGRRPTVQALALGAVLFGTLHPLVLALEAVGAVGQGATFAAAAVPLWHFCGVALATRLVL